MAQAVVFIGLQGSGKTTYFNAHFAATHEHVSRDVLGTAEREAAFLRECIRSGRSFVVDDTNATRVTRAPLIREAKTAGYDVFAYFSRFRPVPPLVETITEETRNQSRCPPSSGPQSTSSPLAG